MFQVAMGAMVTDSAQVTTQRSVSNRSWKPCSTQPRSELSKTSGMMMIIGAKGDDDRCGVDGPTLTTS